MPIKCNKWAQALCMTCECWFDQYNVEHCDWIKNDDLSPCYTHTWNHAKQTCEEEYIERPCKICGPKLIYTKSGKPKYVAKFTPKEKNCAKGRCVAVAGKEEWRPICKPHLTCQQTFEGGKLKLSCVGCDPPCNDGCEKCIPINNDNTKFKCKNLCGGNMRCVIEQEDPLKYGCNCILWSYVEGANPEDLPPGEQMCAKNIPTVYYETSDDGVYSCGCRCEVVPADCNDDQEFDGDSCKCVYTETQIESLFVP